MRSVNGLERMQALAIRPGERKEAKMQEGFLYAMSAFWLVVGTCAILYTEQTRDAYRRLISEPGRRAAGAAALIFGLLLVASGGASHYPWFIRLLGMAAVIKGGVVLANPGRFWNRVSRWCTEDLSDQAYRFSGIVNVILGTAVMSWIA